MSGRKILAFYSPYPRAGKSQATLAALIDWFPLCKTYSFAGPVRDIVSSILHGLSINMRVLWDEKDMPINDRRFGALTPRDLMKAFGALGRDLYPDMWADMFAEELNRAPCHCFVVDDLRFPNEYAMLRKEDAKIIRVTVPGREIVPSTTEALLEGYEFDAELENTMNGIGYLPRKSLEAAVGTVGMICRNWEQEMMVETDVSGLVPCPFSHAHIQCETSLSLHAYRGFDVECVGVVECTCGARMRASEFIACSVEDEEAEADRCMQIALRKAAEAWNRRGGDE